MNIFDASILFVWWITQKRIIWCDYVSVFAQIQSPEDVKLFSSGFLIDLLFVNVSSSVDLAIFSPGIDLN